MPLLLKHLIVRNDSKHQRIVGLQTGWRQIVIKIFLRDFFVLEEKKKSWQIKSYFFPISQDERRQIRKPENRK